MRSIFIMPIFGFALAIPAFAAPLPIPTNLPEASTLPAPPASFDPLRASPDELAAYGFPQRPSTLNRAAYDHWVDFMQHARVRVMPLLRRLGVVHGPAQHASVPGFGSQQYTRNWSGYVIANGATSLGGNSITRVTTTFNVPIAQSPFGQCASALHESSWTGIDGWNPGVNAILQAGTESDSYCANGSTTGIYYAWYEWFPNNTVQITNLPVRVGDVFSVYLVAESPTSGQVIVENATTNQYAFINAYAPAGSHLAGGSAEWIVERPSFNNNLSSLANYVATWMSGTGADVANAWFPWGAPIGGNTSYNVTMLDNNNAPLSTARGLYNDGILLNVAGTAK